MTKHYLFLLYLLFISPSCTSWKGTLVSKGDRNDAIRNAITDFIHNNKLHKNDYAFDVYAVDIDSELLGVSIFGTPSKIPVVIENGKNLGYKNFPTMYHIQHKKIFYWNDSSKAVTDDLMNVLSKSKLIDTITVGNFPLFTIDERKKAANYYFCKNNLKLYKKENTSRAIGYGRPLKVKCK